MRLTDRQQLAHNKVHAHAAALKKLPLVVKLADGRTAQIERCETGRIRKGKDSDTWSIRPRVDGADQLWLLISVGGRYLNGDGWYGFHNPPVRVHGQDKDDPTEALRVMLQEVL